MKFRSNIREAIESLAIAALAVVAAFGCSEAKPNATPDSDKPVDAKIAPTAEEDRATVTAAITLGTWTERGPAKTGGRVNGLYVDTSVSPAVWLAGSAGGGIWRTTEDAAATWGRSNSGITDGYVLHLEADTIRAGRTYAQTWSGLFYTTDRGLNWTTAITPTITPPGLWAPTSAGSTVVPKAFTQLRFNASQSFVLSAPSCNGLWYSADGSSFTQHFPFAGGSSNQDNCITDIAADRFTKRVYITMAVRDSSRTHVYRSCPWTATTPCLTWEAANTNLPTWSQGTRLTYTGSGGTSTRLAMTVNDGGASYLWESTDGLAWTKKGMLPNNNVSALAYAGTGNELFVGSTLAYYSPDHGATWTTFHLVYQHPDPRAIFVSNATHKVYTATDGAPNFTKWTWNLGSAPTGGILFKDGDPGTPQEAAGSRIKAAQLYYAAVVPPISVGEARRTFLGTQDNSGICYQDVALPPGIPTEKGVNLGGSVGDYPGMAFNKDLPRRAYSFSPQGLYRSDNTQPTGGASDCSATTWSPLSVGFSGFWNNNVVAVWQSKVYTVDNTKVQYSPDQGASWTQRTLPVTKAVTALSTDGSLYAGTLGGGAFRSTDDGATWSNWAFNSGTPPAFIMALHTGGDPGTTPKAYWIASSSGLHRQISAGGWTTVAASGSVVSDVVTDPTCRTRVYAALGFGAGHAMHGGGIIFSADNGATWTQLAPSSGAASDLKITPVTDLSVDPLTPSILYVGTFGRGMWTYNWSGNLPACQP